MNQALENILWLLLGHCILDYPMQSSFMATNKGKNNFILGVHSMIYGLGVSLILKILGAYSPFKAIILVVSHFTIDYIKSHAKDQDRAMTTYLYIDQAVHMIINIVMLYIR